jgi:hypothetical protein
MTGVPELALSQAAHSGHQEPAHISQIATAFGCCNCVKSFIEVSQARRPGRNEVAPSRHLAATVGFRVSGFFGRVPRRIDLNQGIGLVGDILVNEFGADVAEVEAPHSRSTGVGPSYIRAAIADSLICLNAGPHSFVPR